MKLLYRHVSTEAQNEQIKHWLQTGSFTFFSKHPKILSWRLFNTNFFSSLVFTAHKPTYATKQRPKAAPASAAGCICYTPSEASAAWLCLSNIRAHQHDTLHPPPIWWVQTYWQEAANFQTACTIRRPHPELIVYVCLHLPHFWIPLGQPIYRAGSFPISEQDVNAMSLMTQKHQTPASLSLPSGFVMTNCASVLHQMIYSALCLDCISFWSLSAGD